MLAFSRNVATISLLAVALALCSTHEQAPTNPNPGASELEYPVYSAYITEAFTGAKGEDRTGRHVSNIVIINMTRSDMDDTQMRDDNDKPLSWEKVSKYLRKDSPTLQRDTIEKLREVGTQSVPLRSSFQLPVPSKLVEAGEIDAIFKNGGWWTDFYKKYPGSQGYLVLSRIGFSSDGNQALFYASNACGGKCGTGTYVVMRKNDTGWKLEKEILVWIS